MDNLIQRRDLSSRQFRVKALDAQQNLVRHGNQRGEESTSHQTGKNLSLNSGLPQKAEGRLITSQRPLITLFGVKLGLSG
jgi:hypothetical protein